MRPLAVRLPPALALRIYSRGRTVFLDRYRRARPRMREVPERAAREIWGVPFRAPLWNAAGMWKDGRGYRAVAGSGAGAFLAGTSTGWPRGGNCRDGVRWPFAPFPRSGAAANWLGLPNPGHEAVARTLAKIERVAGCPVGASLSLDPDPDLPEAERFEALQRGVEAYVAAGVDFLELNESCPNTEEGGAGRDDLSSLRERLGRIVDGLPSSRPPLVVKLSTDLAEAAVPAVVDLLLDAGIDGLNLGNTSTDREAIRGAIHPAERPLFDRFAERFGGGLSGRPLRERSLRLVEAAAERLSSVGGPGAPEFAVLRTGGVESAEDLRRTLDAGAAAAQWYTGYFEAFSHRGWDVYPELFSSAFPP